MFKFNIVLIHPLIPQNTGNIGRLCLATNSVLHLVEPLGFELTDRYLNRAGLDYWKHVEVRRYKSCRSFFERYPDENFIVFSSRGKTEYWNHVFRDGDFLLFGCETTGLPDEIMKRYQDNALTIPQFSNRVRCLNLSNSVSIVLYEAIRQVSKPVAPQPPSTTA